MELSDDVLCRCLIAAGHRPGDAITRTDVQVLRDFAAAIVGQCLEVCTQLEIRAIRSGREERYVAASNAYGNCRREIAKHMTGEE